MADRFDDLKGRLAGLRAEGDPLDELLDRLEPPAPSAALVARIHRLGTKNGARTDARRPVAGPASGFFRPWATGMAGAAAAVLAAYLMTGDPVRAPVVVAVPPAATLALQFGALHPADPTLADADDDEEGDDDETLSVEALASTEMSLI